MCVCVCSKLHNNPIREGERDTERENERDRKEKEREGRGELRARKHTPPQLARGVIRRRTTFRNCCSSVAEEYW